MPTYYFAKLHWGHNGRTNFQFRKDAMDFKLFPQQSPIMIHKIVSVRCKDKNMPRVKYFFKMRLH